MPNASHNTLLYRNDANIGNYWAGAVPNIIGSLTAVAMNPFNYSGAFSVGSSSGTVPGPNSGSIQRRYIDFYASRVSTVYKDGTDSVHPRSLNVYMVIKYI